MNLKTEQNPEGVLILRAAVAEADYAPDVEKSLREYRRKANVPGFRPGMVPMGIINKMYRKGVVAEQAYRKANEAVFKHLEDSKTAIMGDVMPSELQSELDFNAPAPDEGYEFVFEAGVAPAVDVVLDKGDKLTYNKIKVSKEMREGYRGTFTRRFGRLEDVDVVKDGDEALEVTLDNGTIKADDAYFGLVSMSEDERKPFIGKKAGDTMMVNVREIYRNPAQLAATLGVKQEELDAIAPEFTATVKRIRKFAEPPLDAEFFTQAFPDGSVTDVAGFEKFIDETIAGDLARDSDYLLSIQLKNHLLAKANLKLPEQFLKNWLFAVNEGKFTMEQIEADFAGFLRTMAWDLIQKHFAESLGLEVSQDDLLAEARNMARMQFAQYGMVNVPDETLDGYAKSILGNREEAQRIYERAREDKTIAALKPLVTITEKSISRDEFQKIANETGN
ncbi:MAG: trigger factor [Alistipes sp.]|jgi:trigger factor|nr:trigger factor [Alistipes sp.]